MCRLGDSQEHLQDPARLSDFLERQPRIHYPNGIKRAYHGLYAGFHLNEIVRRADPQGRSIGTVVMQVCSLPFCVCGVREVRGG